MSSQKKYIKSAFTEKEKVKGLIALAILLGLLGALIYFISGSEFLKSKQILKPQTDLTEEQDQKVLDCSKKLAQEEIDLNDESVQECLFINCGNFFE